MNDKLEPSSGQVPRWFKPAIALATLGFLYSAVWSWWILAHPLDSLPGCGGNSGCATVLSSRWSRVFGFPVTLPAAGVYVGLLASILLRRRTPVLFFSAVLMASALWFLSIQALVLRAFCPLCLGAHAIGFLAGLLGAWGSFRATPAPDHRAVPLALAIAATALLALFQIFGPAPAGHRLTSLNPHADPKISIHARGQGRLVTFANGSKSFAIESLPHLGDPHAPHVLVEYFDYQCEACRIMHGHLSALIAMHPDKVCLILLPVPLDSKCNPSLPESQNPTPGSCLLARLSLAVWRNAPDKFPDIHRAFFANPAPSDPAAERMARGHLPPDSWPRVLSDPWIDQILAANIQDWKSLSSGGPKLPKILLNQSKVLHGLPSGRDEFLRVITAELGL